MSKDIYIVTSRKIDGDRLDLNDVEFLTTDIEKTDSGENELVLAFSDYTGKNIVTLWFTEDAVKDMLEKIDDALGDD